MHANSLIKYSIQVPHLLDVVLADIFVRFDELVDFLPELLQTLRVGEAIVEEHESLGRGSVSPGGV